MSPKNARNAYASATVGTVPPAQLLIMLYDALVKNLMQAETALEEGNKEVAHEKLILAQDIVGEFIASLDPKGFDGGEQLLALYTFWYGELIDANIEKDRFKVKAIRSLVEPMAQTWREAYSITTSDSNQTAVESISISG